VLCAQTLHAGTNSLYLEAENMKKILVALVGALFVTMLMAGGASAQTDDAVLPVDGECPAGFELGYSDEFGEVCDSTLERGDDADAVTVAATGAGTLPRTGSDSLPLAQIGAVLVAAGGLVVLITRKRATHTS
jgi:LPXTG-motif cell wall-anchored protein